MKATVLFSFHGIAALFFGLGFLFMPGMMTDMMNVSTDAMGLIGWQFFGLGILTIGGIACGSQARPISSPPTLQLRQQLSCHIGFR